MNKRYRYLVFLLVGCLLATGCAESNQQNATGKGNIRGINTVVDAPGVSFMIEERNLDTIAFKASSATQQFDDLNYSFNFDLQVPGETSRRRLATTNIDVVPDHDYLFFLTGSIANPGMVVRDTEVRQWTGSETVFEASVDHFANSLGPVDVYFSAPDTDPVAGNAIGTLAYGERIDATEFAEGGHELILTPAGDPATILYRSGSLQLDAGATDSLVIFDKDPSTTGDVNVRLYSAAGVASELADSRFPPEVSYVHAAQGLGNVDIAEDDEFSPPLVADLAFGARTASLPVTAGTKTYTYTAAGNMGAELLENEQTNATGQRYTRILVGPTDDPNVFNSQETRRPFSTSARLSITDVALNFESLDVYLIPGGESVDDSNPRSNTAFELTTGMVPVEAGNYDVAITLSGEKTIVAGPTTLSLANGDVVDLFILDTADPNTAQFSINRLAP